MSNRADRRAVKFGHFSPNRCTHQPNPAPTVGLALELEQAYDEDYNKRWELYLADKITREQRQELEKQQNDPRFDGHDPADWCPLESRVDRYDYFTGL